MLVHLVATIALAVVACLLLWAIGRRFRRPLPGYALPMVAAAVAIGYGVYAEYSWASRMEAGLPASIVVLSRVEDSSALAPWTLLLPRVERFSAVDTTALRRHPAHPELRLAEVLLLQRFHPVRRVPQLVDCAGARVADVPPDGGFDAEGLPADPRWRSGEDEARLVTAVCEAG